MWQLFVDILTTAVLWNFYFGAVYGVVLFFYLWYNHIRTDGGRWPLFASDREYVLICAFCFVPIVNIVPILASMFLVALTWDLKHPDSTIRE